MKGPRKRYQTQWAGQFGAAHELCRRGYLVTFTAGNAPRTDLVCESPEGVPFSVQVKSVSSRNAFICQKLLLEPNDKLFFVFVGLPRSLSEHPEYFILNHEQFLKAIHEQDRVGKNRKKPPKPFSPCISYSVMAKLANEFHFRNAWENLPR